MNASAGHQRWRLAENGKASALATGGNDKAPALATGGNDKAPALATGGSDKAPALATGGNDKQLVIPDRVSEERAERVGNPCRNIEEARSGAGGSPLKRGANRAEGVDKSTPFRPVFGLGRRFFATISMTCKIVAKYVHAHPSPPPA